MHAPQERLSLVSVNSRALYKHLIFEFFNDRSFPRGGDCDQEAERVAWPRDKASKLQNEIL